METKFLISKLLGESGAKTYLGLSYRWHVEKPIQQPLQVRYTKNHFITFGGSIHIFPKLFGTILL